MFSKTMTKGVFSVLVFILIVFHTENFRLKFQSNFSGIVFKFLLLLTSSYGSFSQSFFLP